MKRPSLLAIFLVISLLVNAGAIIAWQASRHQLFEDRARLDPEGFPTNPPASNATDELLFLRDLLARWYAFQSNNYLSSQAALIPWLSKDLAESKQAEIARLAPKMRDRQVEQNGEVLSIKQQVDPSTFETVVRVTLTEDSQTTVFLVQSKVQIQKVPRSLENVWGYQVVQFQPRIIKTRIPLRQLSIAAGVLSVLTLPCTVQEAKVSDPESVQLKIVTTRHSELMILAAKPLSQPVSLLANCENREFQFGMITGPELTRLLAVQSEEGLPARRRLAEPRKDRREIKQSLAKELGFEIEDTDKSE